MNKNKYVFISQPMKGLSNIEILAARNRAKDISNLVIILS